MISAFYFHISFESLIWRIQFWYQWWWWKELCCGSSYGHLFYFLNNFLRVQFLNISLMVALVWILKVRCYWFRRIHYNSLTLHCVVIIYIVRKVYETIFRIIFHMRSQGLWITSSISIFQQILEDTQIWFSLFLLLLRKLLQAWLRMNMIGNLLLVFFINRISLSSLYLIHFLLKLISFHLA